VSIQRRVKRAAASAMASDIVAPLFTPLLRGAGCIFMMHRFADPDRGNGGHDPTLLRANLAYLRRHRFDLVSVHELFRRMRDRDRRLAKSVAFTIDDGYADFASAGAPAFAEFDCPATVFVVTGVTDDRGWYWWDRLSFVLQQSERNAITVEIGGEAVHLAWPDRAAAPRIARTIIDRMKRVSDGERRRVLQSVEDALAAEVPPIAPPRYASMTWDEVRACARGGTTFGAHTVTHPILARTDDAVARHEIETSWRRLRQETGGAVPVFCYPNGDTGDLGPREMSILRDVGVEGAVTSRPGYASASAFHADADAPFLVRRFPYGGEPNEVVQVVSGAERLKMAVRRLVSG
jgi:peptidoglycan/xylan/chitin deacetylase (PgdA/CDA1 family)